jgi:hypothetical protein
MKKSLLTERFQQLAGIKPLYELDEGGAQNDGTPAAKQISTNKPLRNNILKYIESKLKPGQSVERLFQMEDVAKEYIKNYVTEKEPHYKAIADSKNDMHFWYQTMQQHLQGGLDEELKFHPLNEVKNSLKKSIKRSQRLNENEGEISVNINRKDAINMSNLK